jgi:hypothetical protein
MIQEPKQAFQIFSDNEVCSFYWIFPRVILNNVKPVGIADLTASTASDAFPHSSLKRKAIFLVSAASSIIAQFGRN